MFTRAIGIDLGTTYTLIHVPHKGIVLNEPSVVAISKNDRSVIAVGLEAKDMLGRTPDTIIALKPLKDGVIADYKVTEAMLKYFINKALGNFRLFRPDIMIAVPAGITSTERRAVMDAAIASGARQAYIIKEPIAAAIGAGIPIGNPYGYMIIDIGGGTSEIAVISLGGIVASTSIRVGGNKFDMAISEFIKKKYGLGIGERTAEDIKIKIGSAIYLEQSLELPVRGRDMLTGLPKTITVTSNDITDAIHNELNAILSAIKMVFSNTPPELAADIIEQGITLSGGTSLLRNMDKLVTHALNVRTYVADDSILCVAKGTGIALDNLDIYKKSLVGIPR